MYCILLVRFVGPVEPRRRLHAGLEVVREPDGDRGAANDNPQDAGCAESVRDGPVGEGVHLELKGL